jgi:hypothetical protein
MLEIDKKERIIKEVKIIDKRIHVDTENLDYRYSSRIYYSILEDNFGIFIKIIKIIVLNRAEI